MGQYSTDSGSSWLWLTLGVLAIVLLGAMVATVVSVREPAVISDRRRTSLLTTLHQTLKDIKNNHDFIWFLVSRLLVFMAFTTIQQFALYYLQDVIGVINPAEATARFTVLAVAAMLIFVWPAGYFSDRIGRKLITTAAGLLGALGMGIIFSSENYGTILWAAVIIGSAMGIFNSTNWALATDLVAKGEEARYLAIANMATAGGAALSRLIGPLIDFFNEYSPGLGYKAMLLACFIYFVAGSLLILKIKKHI
jgi:Na+/melibiose symporter-like transporter